MATPLFKAACEKIVDAVALELKSRGITSSVSACQVKAESWSPVQQDRTKRYQITHAVEYSSADIFNISEHLLDSPVKLRECAIELACKLARPYNLICLEVEIPETIEEALRLRDKDDTISIRFIRAYDVNTDTFIFRMDLVVKWDEGEDIYTRATKATVKGL